MLCWFQLIPGNCTCYFFNKPAPRNLIQPPLVVFFWNFPIDHPFHLLLRNWSSCTNFLTLPIMFAKYKSGMQMVNYMPSSRAVWYTYCIVIVHYTITSYYWISGHTRPNNSAFLFCRHDWYCSPTT